MTNINTILTDIYYTFYYDPFLLVLTASTFILLVAAVLLIVHTVILRRANIRKEALWREFEKKWQPLLFDVLSGDSSPESLTDMIAPQERFQFVDFLSKYAFRFSGVEKQTLELLAAPFLPAVAQRANQGDADQQARAIVTIGLLGPRNHVEVFKRAIETEAPIVVMAAVRTLASLGDPNLIRTCFVHIKKAESWNINYLSQLFSSSGPAYMEPAREILADTESHPWLRILAAESLRRGYDFHAADIAAAICESVEAEDPNVVCAALRLLRETAAERHLRVVRPLAAHVNSAIRVNAVNTLGLAGTNADLPILRSRLEDASEWVVWAAAEGLVALGDKKLLKEIAETGHRASAAVRAVLEQSAHGIDEPLVVAV